MSFKAMRYYYTAKVSRRKSIVIVHYPALGMMHCTPPMSHAVAHQVFNHIRNENPGQIEAT